MRSQLFRETVVVEESDQIVLVKDVDGVDPFDLFVENVDVKASLRTRYGSKNANILFTAVDAGSAGNSLTVTISDVTGEADDVFAVDVTGNDVTITLARDASGWPTMTADQIIAAVNADMDFAAILLATRARGSDGSAIVGIAYDIDPTQLPYDFTASLADGADATTAGDVDVFVGPTKDGPWQELADTTFDSMAAGAVKKLAFTDAPIRGLKVTASAGAYPTVMTFTGVARRKVL